jgi:hypothetical protein
MQLLTGLIFQLNGTLVVEQTGGTLFRGQLVALGSGMKSGTG